MAEKKTPKEIEREIIKKVANKRAVIVAVIRKEIAKPKAAK